MLRLRLTSFVRNELSISCLHVFFHGLLLDAVYPGLGLGWARARVGIRFRPRARVGIRFRPRVRVGIRSGESRIFRDRTGA